MKILSANTGLGIPDMNCFRKNVAAHIAFHGWNILPFLLFKSSAVKHMDLSSRPSAKRRDYCAENSTLENTIALLMQEKPDIFGLQEVLEQYHQDTLEQWLTESGYKSWSWGRSAHHSDAWVSTLVASKTAATPLYLKMPQSARMGGGGGIAGLRFEKWSFISFHLTHGDTRETFQQLTYLKELSVKEAAAGQIPLLIGDFNIDEKLLRQHGIVDDKNLKSAKTAPTCPTLFPLAFQKKLDQLLLPPHITCEVQVIDYGSDHAALVAEVEVE